MKYYLVEAYSSDIKFDGDDTIIALTPLASYELDKAGVKYSILEDYYDESKFLKEEEDYFNDQLNWFNEFDNFLFNIFPEAKVKNLKLATVRYFHIKCMVDSLILRCKVLDTFINKVNPNDIIYISMSWKKDVINPTNHPLQFRKSQSLFSRFIPLFCEKYDINFQRIMLKEEVDSNDINSGNYYFLRRIKNGLKCNKHVKNLWYFYKTFCINNIFSKSFSNYRYNILFLKTHGFVKDIIKEAQKKGHRIFYKQGKNVIKQSFMYNNVIGSIYPDIISNSKQDTKNYVKKIDKTKIITWINDYCNIDITNIIMPRLQYFINEWCPKFIFLVDKYINFYNENQIDLVITPHMVLIDEFAAIIATRYNKKTKSACLQHGDAVFDLKIWDFGEYLPYDIYFTTNYEMEKYIKYRVQFRNIDTKVFQYSNRYKILPKVNNLKNKVRSEADRKTLVYVPTMYQWDNTFWAESRMPDTWYYCWHKELIKYFGSKKDFNFIWKGIPASNEIYDPIPNLINDQGYKNIKYATEPFIKWIKKADLVLLDYPSTALYEAAVSGLPVMSLYFPFNVVRETALKLFGKSLQPFNNFNNGIAKINEFLNSNPDEFVVSIPYSKTSILKTLDKIKVI